MKLFWLFFICYLPVSAQESFEIRYNIKLDDNFNKDDPKYRRHNGVLRISEGNSMFFMDAIDKFKDDRFSSNFSIDTILMVKTSTLTNELFSVELLFGKGMVWVKDSLYPIKWTIDTVSKKIAEFNCTKARCTFRGRNYVAWFAPEIPISAGPWKLGGLPGLILEVEDEDKFFTAYFTKLTPTSKPIEMPLKSIDRSEFLKRKARTIEILSAAAKARSQEDCLTCQTDVKITATSGLEMY